MFIDPKIVYPDPGDKKITGLNIKYKYKLLKNYNPLNYVIICWGSRDRSINLWPVDPTEDVLRPVAKFPDAHKGWVWTLSSTRNQDLISGAWDSFIKFWKVT